MIGMLSTTITAIEPVVNLREGTACRVEMRIAWTRRELQEEVTISLVMPRTPDLPLSEIQRSALNRAMQILDAQIHPDPQKHLQD